MCIPQTTETFSFTLGCHPVCECSPSMSPGPGTWLSTCQNTQTAFKNEAQDKYLGFGFFPPSLMMVSLRKLFLQFIAI